MASFCRRAPRRVVRLLAATVSLILVTSPAFAQEEDGQFWFQANTNVPLADNVRVTLEQIARTSDRQDGVYQTEFGGLLGYRAAKGVELGFGYRKVGAHNGNTGANEDRLRQQIVATFGPFTTRFRVDERFNPRGSEVGFRVRPLVRYNYRIGKRGHALFFSHESFLLPNSTRWGQRSGYERMRNIVGVALPLRSRVAADVGYLNQYRFARGSSRAQMDHALSLQLTINLNAFKMPRVHY
ncbi:hypothetical protein ASE75_02615 [Sphingomonas sp. Leaf17]|uniref:DUF2490 domain-containing protein n=1 Tax=Sphingomonas sp. Leaf17 TaxID=1735683 RepID=UPI0006FE2463|nr:DUF2490 domain-containing protein [Sphingomonas sp. Leaf17]KQM67809.1 hypothetical protein ASE75_02615 [Sphingomonas sp. Leaf17]